MGRLKFIGLGTHWQIITDETEMPQSLGEKIVKFTEDFERRFSRFLDESEVGQINLRAPGHFVVSPKLAKILRFGLDLAEKSQGYFDPAVATILAAYGYDQELKLKPQAIVYTPHGTISLNGHTLTLSGNTSLDIGGWGKGYLIDQLYEFLLQKGLEFFLIDGGGDFRGTSKKSGQAWRIALEHPLDAESTLGVFELKNGALANSGITQRRVGSFHHLIDFKTARPVQSKLSSHVLAPTATIADGLATALFVSPSEVRNQLAKLYPIEYMLVGEKLRAEVTPGFKLKI